MNRFVTLYVVVFIFSLLAFSIVLMPARALKSLVVPETIAEPAIARMRVSGLWWKGRAETVWQEQRLSLSWEMDWRGFRPGLMLSSAAGLVEVGGWIGVKAGNVNMEGVSAVLPVATMSKFLPLGHADGVISVSGFALTLADQVILDIAGEVSYSGGEADFGFGDSVVVPPIMGLFSMPRGAPQLDIHSSEEVRLARIFIEQDMVILQVLRAFPQLLGMSDLEGDAADEVYRVSQPLDLSALAD
jgi:general secretion pathway protein N